MKFESYFKESFFSDLKAGFITAVVALPLAIGFAIASGVSPIMGLYTAIIAGALGSGFGGSKFSITGPTGAMTVVILSTMHRYDLEGLLVAGFLAGVFQILFGLMKMGQVVKYMPFPIISGFTAGIGAIIFIGQIPNALGLNIPAKEFIWQTFFAILEQISSVSFIAIAISLATILILIFLPKHIAHTKHFKAVPPSILALAGSTILVYLFSLNIPLVGAIPLGFPTFNLFNINFELIRSVLPAAFTIALLGAIESLLCAVVCDGMTNTRHDSDKELVSQGIVNLVLPFFNGIPATAAVARSAVNIREGAKTNFAGIIHAGFILVTLLFFGPVVQFIPKAFLAGILMYVSSKMINLHEFQTVMHTSRSETIVLLMTFGLTIFTDLVFAVQVGMFFAILLVFIELTNLINISQMEEYDQNEGINKLVNSNPKLKDKVAVYTIQGPFFFGTMNMFERKINQYIDIKSEIIIIRMKHVPFIDSTGVLRLVDFIRGRNHENRKVFLARLKPEIKKALMKNKEFTKLMKQEYIFDSTSQALEYISKNMLE